MKISSKVFSFLIIITLVNAQTFSGSAAFLKGGCLHVQLVWDPHIRP